MFIQPFKPHIVISIIRVKHALQLFSHEYLEFDTTDEEKINKIYIINKI